MAQQTRKTLSRAATADMHRLIAALREAGADVTKLVAALDVGSPILAKHLEMTVKNASDRPEVWDQITKHHKRLWTQLQGYLEGSSEIYAGDRRIEAGAQANAKEGRVSSNARVSLHAADADWWESLSTGERGDWIAERRAEG